LNANSANSIYGRLARQQHTRPASPGSYSSRKSSTGSLLRFNSSSSGSTGSPNGGNSSKSRQIYATSTLANDKYHSSIVTTWSTCNLQLLFLFFFLIYFCFVLFCFVMHPSLNFTKCM